MCLSLVWPDLECCPSCSGSCGDTAGVNTGHSWALLALGMVKTLNFGLCAKTGSGVCSQMGESAICKENKQGAFKIWVPQQICRGVMESYSWAGDFILGVAKHCYSANSTTQSSGGLKAPQPRLQRTGDVWMALGYLMLRVLPTVGRRSPLPDTCLASLG